MNILASKVNRLYGVSDKTQLLLNKLGIFTCEDLLRFFPRRYENWVDKTLISDLQENIEATIEARVDKAPVVFKRGRFNVLNTVLADDSGTIKAVWFNQAYLENKLRKGTSFIFRAKAKRGKWGLELQNPSFEFVDTASNSWKAVYPLTAGLTQHKLRKFQQTLWNLLNADVPELLPLNIRKKYKLSTAAFAYEQIHKPRDEEAYQVSKRRLVFEELFLLQLGLRLLRTKREEEEKAYALPLDAKKLAIYKTVWKAFPFELTRAQRRVLNEVAADISSEKAMHRLIQGDVGSGKTVVAVLAMMQAVLNNKQAALLAPTSILAEQHFASISKMLALLPVKVLLLTGQQSAKERKKVLEQLESGQADIVVGTHAILQNQVKFKCLGLTVTDEQHRFGVKQRLALDKDKMRLAHSLVMSATPIPRSLALILYGDLDISILDELPSGRKKVETISLSSKDEARVRQYIELYLGRGQQVYVVCPLLEDSEANADLSSVNSVYEEYSKIFKDYRLALIHGSLKEKEKNSIMQSFYRAELDILVATTVVEVGVDNPRANLMIIKNAERFGLAQLHQLRGRVGRSQEHAVCILQSDKDDELTVKRLSTMCKTSDGFKIAEADLELRGPGDFFGTRQHGLPQLRLANLYEDVDLLKLSGQAVVEFLAEDPQLQSNEAKKLILHLKNSFTVDFSRVGL